MQLFVQFVFGSVPCAAKSESKKTINMISTAVFMAQFFVGRSAFRRSSQEPRSRRLHFARSARSNVQCRTDREDVRTNDARRHRCRRHLAFPNEQSARFESCSMARYVN